MKKQIISVLVVLAILFSFSGMAVSAETVENVSLERVQYVEDEQDYTDLKIYVPFSCGGFEGEISVGNGLEYVSSAVVSDLSEKNPIADTVKIKNGKIRLVIVGKPNTGTTGEFITLKFKNTNKTPFVFTSPKFSDTNGKNVPVKINNVMLGDANSDYVINILDLVRIKKILANIDTTDNFNCDCNRDGSIDAEDISRLCSYLLLKITAF